MVNYENCMQGGRQVMYSIDENSREMKLYDINTIIQRQERLIHRLQSEQSKRIEEYQHLRRSLEINSNGLQDQINKIRGELQIMYEQTKKIRDMEMRLVRCEEGNVRRQISNDSEFQALRDVMQHVCGRMDRMEELQNMERQCDRERERQQQHQVISRAAAPVTMEPPAQYGPGLHKIPSTIMPRVICPVCNKNLSRTYLNRHLKRNSCKSRSSPRANF